MNPTDDLTVALPTDREVVLTRVLDAPRELVWAAHTEAAHLARWWGRGNPLDVEIDLRVGGRYRFVEHAPDGNAYAFHGEFLQIEAPERIVQTFEFEGAPGQVAVETLVFTEQDGRTVVTGTTRFDSTAARDAMVGAGMADGARESYRALEKYLTTQV
ncbi:SRPBCC family protein [Micromonospora sp. URMC 105]|uniref:SRPBCC family protein n=1 Tax=Micromonospora sp. URMC 105 TaxID=3423413 RepID=UPI003F193085